MNAERKHAVEEADELNKVMGPSFAAYIGRMHELAEKAGRPLYTCIPFVGPVMVAAGGKIGVEGFTLTKREQGPPIMVDQPKLILPEFLAS